MERLTRVAARGFQGADFDEALPPRLLLTGPNGSGKTTRLRAINIALLGTGKDGLAPWATSDLPFVVVEASTGLRIQRASKIVRGEDGSLSVANRSAVEPSQGEKTAEAVAARIDRELAPNVLALTLDAFWRLSGAERRRALLDAIGAGAALDPAEIRRRLDAEFGAPEEIPSVRRAWERVSAAVRPTGDGMAYLAALEGAAKAQASAYRANRAGVDALAGAALDGGGAPASMDALRATLAEADKAVSDLEGALAAGTRGAADRAARKRDVERLLAALPADVRGLAAEAQTFALNKAAALAALEVGDLDLVAESAAEALRVAVGIREKAREALGRAEGRHRAIRALLAVPEVSEDEGEDAVRCPVCARPGYDPALAEAAIERAAAAWDRARRTSARADGKVALAEADAVKAANAASAARKAHDDARKAVEVLERLDEAERLLAGGAEAAAPVPDEAAVQAARERRGQLRAQIDAASKAEGERKVRLEAARAAGEAEDLARAAVRIQAAVGPKGLQGSILAGPADALTARMSEAWSNAGRTGTLAFRLTDARGAADARVVLVTKDGRDVDLGSLSGGERAVALACLVCGLAALKPDRMSVALIEAGEVDRASLAALCLALASSALATVVVATHVDPAGLDVGAFVVRRL